MAIFTRYLYLKKEVINSLIWAILNNEEDEALFWAYELYFSGFESRLFKVLADFYYIYYEDSSLDNSLLNEWHKDKNKHYIIGNIIQYMIHGISTFCEIDVINYFTIEEENGYNVLLKACKYPLKRQSCCEKNTLLIEPGCIDNNILSLWLYYASYTPIWLKRINDYGGSQNKELKKIEFENDEMEDLFNKLYDYEPDEQKYELKNMLWSVENYLDISWCDFYEKYGLNL
jgi:hypothetical protein